MTLCGQRKVPKRGTAGKAELVAVGPHLSALPVQACAVESMCLQALWFGWQRALHTESCSGGVADAGCSFILTSKWLVYSSFSLPIDVYGDWPMSTAAAGCSALD